MRARAPFLVLLTCAAGACATAARAGRPPSSASANGASPVAPRISLAALDSAVAVGERADSANRAKAFDRAAPAYAASAGYAVAGGLDPSVAHYDAACSFALAGDTAQAFAQLERALGAGYRNAAGMATDADLNALHGSARWADLVRRAEASQAAYRRERSDPERARLVTSDIENFWRAYDLAARATTRDEKIDVYRREYFERGSPGLVDFYRTKIIGVGYFVDNLEKHPRFYAAIRESSRQPARHADEMRAAMRKMKALYDDASFPDVYFVIGSMTSSGTVSSRGLLLGAEMNSLTPSTPRDELSAWHRTVMGAADRLPYVVAHELVHFEQRPQTEHTLLAGALREGGADFIGELISGEQTNPAAHAFGDAHAGEVRRRFLAAMRGTDTRDWIANGGTDRVGASWAADLGYYVGYQIARGYYARAADKRQAIRDLLELKEPERILKESGYGGQVSGTR